MNISAEAAIKVLQEVIAKLPEWNDSELASYLTGICFGASGLYGDTPVIKEIIILLKDIADRLKKHEDSSD